MRISDWSSDVCSSDLFRWLVRAHVYRRGWASFWVSEDEIMGRLQEAATVYRDRWLEYIRETAGQPPYWARRGYGLSIGQKYLVRFLLLAGQIKKAAEDRKSTRLNSSH